MNKRHPGTVIHNGVRKEVFQHSLIKKHPTIVMAARFDVSKRQDLLIRALEKISDKSLHLILLGDGPKLLACQELANNLNIENRVHFLGSVTMFVSIMLMLILLCLFLTIKHCQSPLLRD